MSLREVEAHSQRLADQKQNESFFISRGWLHDIENGTNMPSVFKLYALAVIYRVHWCSIFLFFGCDLSDFSRDRAMFAPRKTQLASGSLEPDDTVLIPLKSGEGVQLEQTTLLLRLAQVWGEIPVRLIQHLDLRNGVYRFVGMTDRTMYPLIRPGSIVQIDQNQREVVSKWQNEYERRIYFIELRGEYICSWCEMHDGYLSAIPHPNSKCKVRRFSYPREAEIVGRVIGVTMRLIEGPQSNGADKFGL